MCFSKPSRVTERGVSLTTLDDSDFPKIARKGILAKITNTGSGLCKYTRLVLCYFYVRYESKYRYDIRYRIRTTPFVRLIAFQPRVVVFNTRAVRYSLFATFTGAVLIRLLAGQWPTGC